MLGLKTNYTIRFLQVIKTIAATLKCYIVTSVLRAPTIADAPEHELAS